MLHPQMPPDAVEQFRGGGGRRWGSDHGNDRQLWMNEAEAQAEKSEGWDARCRRRREAELPRQRRSQVQLGNEDKSPACGLLRQGYGVPGTACPTIIPRRERRCAHGSVGRGRITHANRPYGRL
jgi:hypothetical protein